MFVNINARDGSFHCMHKPMSNDTFTNPSDFHGRWGRILILIILLSLVYISRHP
jgi:hypothetical protein